MTEHDLHTGDKIEFLNDYKDLKGRVRAKKGSIATVETISPRIGWSDVFMFGYVSVKPEGKNKNIIVCHNEVKKVELD